MRIVVASWSVYRRFRVVVDEPLGEIFTVIHPENWLKDEDGKQVYIHRYHSMEGQYFRFDQVENFVIHE